MEILSYLTYSTSVIWIQMIKEGQLSFLAQLLLAYVRAAFDANLNFLRNERRLGKSQQAQLSHFSSLRVSGADHLLFLRGRGLAGFYFGEQCVSAILFFSGNFSRHSQRASGRFPD